MGKHLTAEDKVKILKRHLVEKEAVSSLCEEYGIHVNTFYEWQKVLFEQGMKAFEKENSKEEKRQAERIDYLEGKLAKKDSALAELLEAHIELKKNLGEI